GSSLTGEHLSAFVGSRPKAVQSRPQRVPVSHGSRSERRSGENPFSREEPFSEHVAKMPRRQGTPPDFWGWRFHTRNSRPPWSPEKTKKTWRTLASWRLGDVLGEGFPISAREPRDGDGPGSRVSGVLRVRGQVV